MNIYEGIRFNWRPREDEMDEFINSLYWVSTPQGYAYWGNVHYKWMDSKEIAPRDLQYLRGAGRHYKENLM